MPSMSDKERRHYREGELGPGVSERRVSSLPKIEGPQVWELSAHPHDAERAGKHIDLRLGNPATGIAHSFVIPKRSELPKPGEMALAVPTYDHTLDYMDYSGPITTDYGRGTVQKGRRTQAEVYHAEPDDPKKTMVRFNLYDGTQPEEFAIVRTKKNALLINKTQTREKRPDIPSGKETYKEVQIEDVDPTNDRQAMMPKLDGAHGIIDLTAGRSPRVFSYRVAKKAQTGLIEHTHKMPELLKTKVPKELGGTLLRGEVVALGKSGVLPAEQIGGLLNSKVWESRAKQKAMGVKLQAFPFDVVKYKGKDMSGATFSEKLKVLKEVESKIGDLWLPEIASTPAEKIDLLNKVKSKQHPLTEEGVVLVEPGRAARPIKAKVTPDFDVYVRDVHPAVSGKTGELHDRAGSVSYSWTPDGPIVGQLGGFKHDEGRDMLRNPDKYVGRVAKVRAMKVFERKDGEMGPLFQPRFREWHLDKGEIEKAAKIGPIGKGILAGGGIGAGAGGLLGYYRPTTPAGHRIRNPTKAERKRSALINAAALGITGAAIGGMAGDTVRAAREARAWRAQREQARKAADEAWDNFWRDSAKRQEQRRRAWDEAYERGYQSSRAGAGGAGGAGSSRGRRWQDDFWEEYARSKGGGGYSSKGRRPGGPSYSAAPTPKWAEGVKTKAEAKKRFREQVKKNHPDWGGNEDTMKRVNAEWDDFQKSYAYSKLAAVRHASFLDEMSKIAGLEGRVMSQLLRQRISPPVTDAVQELEDKAKARWAHLL